MSDLWDAVPQVRWSGSRTDPTAAPVKAEPSVAANVATTAEPIRGGDRVDREPVRAQLVSPAGDSRPPNANAVETTLGSDSAGDPTATSLSPGVSPSSGAPASSGVHASSEVAITAGGDSETVRVAGSTPQDVLNDPSTDQIARLKAALNDDTERAKSPARQVGGAHDVRVRVESMLARARRLFDLGQLREARHAAKTAHDLGDSARLDYSPDEERPIDLVQRIDSQLNGSTGQAGSTSPQTAAPPRTPGNTDSQFRTASSRCALHSGCSPHRQGIRSRSGVAPPARLGTQRLSP